MRYFIFLALILFKKVICDDSTITTPRHGGDGGNEFKVVCPTYGAVTGVTYRSGAEVDQIGFVCTSSSGKTTFGPYGGFGGGEGHLNCPDGQYVSSIYGRSGSRVDQLGIRCRAQSNINDYGQFLGEFGGGGGTFFDDASYAVGTRPVSILVRAGSSVDAIQITYGNLPISSICTTCNQYKEMWASKHGGGGGGLNSFVCPDEGVITGIRYRAGALLDSIGFICTSAKGETNMGPFGGSGGSGPYEDRCPSGSYISSIYGRSGALIDQLGIRCVQTGQVGSGTKRDPHGGTGGSTFDDEIFPTIASLARPVEIRVWSGSMVDAIQIKYGNLPVAINCKVARIEVLDQTITAEPDGFEVIGITSGSTCSTIIQSLTLQSTQTVGETLGVETTEGGEFNWATEVGISVTVGVNFIGKSELTVGLTQTLGGSKSWSYTHTLSTSTETSSSQGVQINYQGPGACLVLGYLNRYKINKDNVPVQYIFQCEGGNMAPRPGTIKLRSKLFGKAYFEDYQFLFKDKASCTTAARSCVSAIQVNNVISDPIAIQNNFYSCFPADSGSARK